MLDPSTELGGVLERGGIRTDVLATLLGQAEEAGRAVPPYWSQIMSDTICSDILDYLSRDAYFTGLKLGVDSRVQNYFRIDRRTGNLFIDLAKRDLLREDILSEIVRLLEARYYFSERVYYHHAKVAAGALVARAVELAVAHDLVTEEDFYDRTDASLVAMLEAKAGAAEAGVKRRILGLLDRFRTRRLLKRVCVYPRYGNEDVQAQLVDRFFAAGSHERRLEAEERIADLFRFATGREAEIVLTCPAADMQLKEAQTHVRWPGESEPRPLAELSERVPRLHDLERSYRDLWKFYVFADVQDPDALQKLQEIAIDEIGIGRNAYRVDRGS